MRLPIAIDCKFDGQKIWDWLASHRLRSSAERLTPTRATQKHSASHFQWKPIAWRYKLTPACETSTTRYKSKLCWAQLFYASLMTQWGVSQLNVFVSPFSVPSNRNAISLFPMQFNVITMSTSSWAISQLWRFSWQRLPIVLFFSPVLLT